MHLPRMASSGPDHRSCRCTYALNTSCGSRNHAALISAKASKIVQLTEIKITLIAMYVTPVNDNRWRIHTAVERFASVQAGGGKWRDIGDCLQLSKSIMPLPLIISAGNAHQRPLRCPRHCLSGNGCDLYLRLMTSKMARGYITGGT